MTASVNDRRIASGSDGCEARILSATVRSDGGVKGLVDRPVPAAPERGDDAVAPERRSLPGGQSVAR